MREKRLYYDDSYLQEFTGQPIQCEQRGEQWFIELNHTAFYPTSGGQPNDLGTIGNHAVLDVVEEGETIWHVLAADPGDEPCLCRINWDRRYDFMQQHSGQHILSQAFLKRLDAMTIGFHLTDTTLTIDLDCEHVSEEDILWVENEANRVIWSGRPIHCNWYDNDQLDTLPLRKLPKVEKDIRIVEVADYDWSPCGGTHVALTSEIGILKIRRVERSKGVTRVEFLCGGRALADYRFKNTFALRMAADLSVKDRDLPEAWLRQQELAKAADAELKQMRMEMLEHRASALITEAKPHPTFALVSASFANLDAAELKNLALHLVSHPHIVALLATESTSGQFVLARSSDVDSIALNGILKQLWTEFQGKGGGTPQLVQGALADATQREAFLSRAEALLAE